MFGFGRKAQKEHVGHSQMEHSGHADTEMGGHTQDTSKSWPKTVLRVEGMTCMHCKMSVEKALIRVQGVESVSVDLGGKETVIIGSVERDILVKAVEDAGYSVPS